MSKPPNAVYVEPSVRTQIDWNPTLLRAAEQLADAGNLRMAAELADEMLADDRILAVLNKRVQGLLGLGLTFEAARGAKRVVKALEAGEDWWKSLPENELTELGKWGTLLGVGIGQLHWEVCDQRLIGRLKVWHPKHLRWDWKKRAWFARVEDGSEVEVTPGDGKWILYTPYGASRPWAKGLWRALSRWWLLKRYAIADWGRYSESHGQGVLVGESEAGPNAPEMGRPERLELASDLASLGRNTGIVPPPGVSIRLLEMTANTYATFEAQKSAADLAAAVLVLGQNLSTEVSGGSFAATDVHKAVEATILKFTAETLSSCLHDQYLVWWAEFNFGSRDVAPWPQWATEAAEDAKSAIEILVALVQTIKVATDAGVAVDIPKLCERFKLDLLPVDPDSAKQQGQIYQYHLQYGVFTTNEIRARLGYPPVKGGDVPPKLVGAASAPAAPADGTTPPADPNADPNAVDPNAGKSLANMLRFAVPEIAHLIRDDVDERPPVERAPVQSAPEENLPIPLVKSKGAAPRRAGFVDGQMYADNLVEAARSRATDILRPDVDAILAAVAKGESFDDIRKRVTAAYKAMNPDKLGRVTADALLMGELAGHAAMHEDTD